jgi:hypothetical protein
VSSGSNGVLQPLAQKAVLQNKKFAAADLRTLSASLAAKNVIKKIIFLC